MRWICFCVGASLLFGACSASKPATPSASPSVAETSSSPQLSEQQATQMALNAFQTFGGRLKMQLKEAMAAGGPVEAVTVCRDAAPQFLTETTSEVGFELGRSSHKLRNPENAPKEAVATYLEKYSDSGAKAPVEATKTGETWTVIAPIVTQPVCLTCHGDTAHFSPELDQALGESYPEDEATGFQAGDLRGVFWAQVPAAL